MQQFECIHCKSVFSSTLQVLLHIWSVHLHQDCALLPEISKLLLSLMVPMDRKREWVYWPDMRVALEDCRFR